MDIYGNMRLFCLVCGCLVARVEERPDTLAAWEYLYSPPKVFGGLRFYREQETGFFVTFFTAGRLMEESNGGGCRRPLSTDFKAFYRHMPL